MLGLVRQAQIAANLLLPAVFCLINITKSKLNLSKCKIYITFGQKENYVTQIVIAEQV